MSGLPPPGEQHSKDRKLNFNPCSLCYLKNGTYMVVGGSNCQAILCTKVTRAFKACACIRCIWPEGQPGLATEAVETAAALRAVLFDALAHVRTALVVGPVVL